MLKACWLWFVIFKKYVELTRPKIESRDPIFFIGTQARSRVSGNDRLFPRGSEFGPNPEIPASPVILSFGLDLFTLGAAVTIDATACGRGIKYRPIVYTRRDVTTA